MKKTNYTTDFYADYVDESSSSAIVIRDALLKYIPKPQSVIDVGCGIGTWLKAWQDIGSEIQGIDGSYVDHSQLLINPDYFKEMDLTQPIAIDRKYDLAETLEVAEHLPENKADDYVAFLCSLSSMILFGAAIPYQGGTDHINEQWPEYWAEKFEKNGFICVDVIRDEAWTNDKCAYYYAQNTFLYIKKDNLNKYPALKEISERTNIKKLGRVHPKKWHEKHERIEATRLEDLIKQIPGTISHTLGRVFRKIKNIII